MAAEAPRNQAPPPRAPTTAASLLPGFPFVRLPPFDVHLPTFDGPLELLLGLLREGDLVITELALVQVTDQYLAHVQALRELDVEAIAGFLAVAAHLLVLKSRAIVPREQPGPNRGGRGGIGGRAGRAAAPLCRCPALCRSAGGAAGQRRASLLTQYTTGAAVAAPTSWAQGRTGTARPGLPRRAGGPRRRPPHGRATATASPLLAPPHRGYSPAAPHERPRGLR